MPEPSRRRRVCTLVLAAAAFVGSLAADLPRLAKAGAAPAPQAAGGYWMVGADGGIFSFGQAPFWGSTGGVRLNQPIVGMAPTPTGKGYWLVATDGGIFTFGDAGFFGSTGAVKLNRPIVGMAPTPTGKGYWLVASDGGMFTFGDAGFFGSGGGTGRQFAGVAVTASGRGYWLGTTTGEVLAFGDAPQLGSVTAAAPVVGMAGTATGRGYWLTTGAGGVHSFGDAPDHGSTAGMRLNQPMVGFSAAPGGGSSPTTSPTTVTTAAPASTTTTTVVTAPPAPGAGPETFPPKESRSGPNTTPPTGGTTCGFPSRPKTTTFPADTENIGSASGLAASTRYPGVYWMIRDGGYPTPALYAIRFGADGQPDSKVIPIRGATNSDWEEVTYSTGPDGRGRLWIVESGDRGVRRIYEIPEPDPDADTEAQIAAAYDYALPGGAGDVVEGAMMHRGYLVVAGKVTPHSKVYIFDRLVAGQTNVPYYLGTLGNSGSISMLRISPDGKMLVTASHEQVQLYRSTDGSGSLASFVGRLPDCEMTAFPGGNVESGEWDGNREILFLDEHKQSQRLEVRP